MSPGTASLGQGKTQQFTATVSGTSNTGVTWSRNPAVGTISTSGLYTAPSSITSQQTVQVTATSVADPTKSASAIVTLNPPVSQSAYSVSFVRVNSTQLQVSWTAPSGHSSYDTITFTGVDSVNWWYVSQVRTRIGYEWHVSRNRTYYTRHLGVPL